MYKMKGLPTHYCVREKGTDIWLTGYMNGKPFLSYKDAQAWLRTAVRSLIERETGYSKKATKADILRLCDDYEIVVVHLTPLLPPTPQPPPEQSRIDAYSDGFSKYDPIVIFPSTNPYNDVQLNGWWLDGYQDAGRAARGSVPFYPDLYALVIR